MYEKLPHNLDVLPVFFKALSDPIRLEILEILGCENMCVGNICKLLNMKQSKVSFHLKILKESGFIESIQEGRCIYYQLSQNRFSILREYLEKCQKRRI